MPEKISLFKELYNELAGYGIEGDTELAHVNTFEASLLKSLGGSGTLNDITNFREYKGGGSQPAPVAPPAQQTITQTSEFPTELKPFISDVLGAGRAEFEREKAEGLQPFPGPQIAPFTPEQQAAFAAGREQFTGLAGTPLARAATYYQPALAATALGTAEIGAEDIGRRMDPFLQNVVDIAKREARSDEEVARQRRAAQAVAGQGFLGGTRPAFVESQAEQDLAERLGDIQARGLSASFQQAQTAAEQQRAREMTGGRQFATLGDVTGARARSDIAGLAGVGETQQQRTQQALDIAKREFEEERAFPQSALQRYASLIRGFPLQATQQRFATQTVPTPSLAQTLVGGLGTAAGLYGAFGGFGSRAAAEGGLVSLQQGGQLPGAGFAMGDVGGAGVAPMPTARQMPTSQDVQEAMELLRQRGAAIRSMSLPQVPQTNLPTEISSQALSGVLPAAEGGLMSVVKRQDGDLVGPITMDDIRRRYLAFKEAPFGATKAEYLPVQEARQAQATRAQEMSQRYEQRQKDLHEQRIREQYGNVAQFFARLGTDVSPAAQAGGISGLLGAGVSSLKETVPEALATEKEFYGLGLTLEDKLSEAELAGLAAQTGVEEGKLSDILAQTGAERTARGEELASGIDIYEAQIEEIQAEADLAAAKATGNLKTSDFNAAMRMVQVLYPNAILSSIGDELVWDKKAMGSSASLVATNLQVDYIRALRQAQDGGLSSIEAQDYAISEIMPTIRAIVAQDPDTPPIPLPNQKAIDELKADPLGEALIEDDQGKMVPSGANNISAFMIEFKLSKSEVLALLKD